MRFFYGIFVLLILCTSLLTAGVPVTGRVLASDEQPLVMGHVHLAPADGSVFKPLKSVLIGKDGRFSVNVERAGQYRLFITGVDHYGLEIPLPLTPGEAPTLNVRLERYRYDLDEPVRVVGDWNRFRFSTAREMKKQADGTWLLVLKSDKPELGYQLIGVERDGHSINGTQQDGYAYDGGGDYISIVTVRDGLARIVFDPSRLKSSDDEARVSFGNSPALQKMYALYESSIKYSSELNNRIRAFKQAHGSVEGFDPRRDEYRELFDTYLTDGDERVRRFAAVQYARLAVLGQQRDEMEKIISLAPYDDPFWSYAPEILADLYTEASGERADELLAHIDQIASVQARGIALVTAGMKAMSDGDQAKQAAIYAQLKNGYADDKRFDYYIRMFNPRQRIAAGREVPPFEVKLIGSEQTVSNRSLLGSYYLMDFWAVWCGPCRAEMPNLHKVYKDYKDAGFKILSLSFDPRISDVERFRAGEWPMPWLHTFVKGGFRSELAKNFEVRGIPKPVLVGPDGKIVASGIQLRGENLAKTLKKFLKK